MHPKTVCVDLDGVLAKYHTWEGVGVIGDLLPGAKNFLEELHRRGWEILIHTTRLSPVVNPEHDPATLKRHVKDWLDIHGMPYDRLHTEAGKPIAFAYVDDRAITCRPQCNSEAYREALRLCEALEVS